MSKFQAGFTLLELIISLALLSVMMLFTNQSIQNGIRAKAKIQDQIEEMSQVRDSLRIMNRDLQQAYHYRDIEAEFKKAVQQATSSTPATPPPATATAPGVPGTPPPPNPATQQTAVWMQQWMNKDPYRIDPTTHFVGTGEDVFFVTLNTGRMSENQAQADFAKVGYFLTSCRKPGATGQTSKCLARSESPLIETDVTIKGPQTVLLENVTEFKLRYIGAGKTDWVSEWNSKSGDGAARNNFPEAVEISLTTARGEGDKKKKVSMQWIAPLHFPNNNPNPSGENANAGILPTPQPGGSPNQQVIGQGPVP